MIDYKLEKVYGNVYHCVIDSIYELGMTFCRLQEYYESPFKNIKGKSFDLLNFMSQYVKYNQESIFTYSDDWCGFNIPDKVFRKYQIINSIGHKNKYDLTIDSIYQDIISEMGDDKFYLIASNGNNDTTFNHEVAHAFYYLNKDYRKTTNKLINKINSSLLNKLKDALLDLGYTKSVLNDEIQAYLSTDYSNLTYDIKPKNKEKLKKFSKLFAENFNHLRDHSKEHSSQTHQQHH